MSKTEWKRLPIELPFHTYFHTTDVTPAGIMYMYGGIVEHESRSDKLFKLRVFFPKLSELFWEKITNQIQHINTLSDDLLINLGIPYSFVERLK